MDPGFAQYLKQFTSSSTARDGGTGKVFLLRNFPGHQEPDAEAAAEAAHRDAVLTNGLECKLSCATSKVRRTEAAHPCGSQEDAARATGDVKLMC